MPSESCPRPDQDQPETCPELRNISPIILHSSNITSSSDPESNGITRHAQTDAQLLKLWLHGRPATTQIAYRSDARRLMIFVGLPLSLIRLTDLQAFADNLKAEGLAPASNHRILSAVKSLFSFGHRLGYLSFDVGKALRLPRLRSDLAERILEESEVRRMIAMEPNNRNRVLLTILYTAGLRVSEACGLRARDCNTRNSGGQITVLGKGGKTRAILGSVGKLICPPI